MNNAKRILATLTLLLLFGVAAAQPVNSRPEMSAEEFEQFQIEMITSQLRLQESKVEPFKKLYAEYSAKMNELQPRGQKRGGGATQNGEERIRPTAEEVEAQILSSFDMAEKSTALKREYYYKFKEILTPQKILRMYNVERRMRERMLSESARRNEKDAR